MTHLLTCVCSGFTRILSARAPRCCCHMAQQVCVCSCCPHTGVCVCSCCPHTGVCVCSCCPHTGVCVQLLSSHRCVCVCVQLLSSHRCVCVCVSFTDNRARREADLQGRPGVQWEILCGGSHGRDLQVLLQQQDVHHDAQDRHVHH